MKTTIETTDQADKPSFDDLFAELDGDPPHDEADLYELFDRMKLHYPEHIEEVLQRLETREDKARDQLIHAKAEAQVLRANAKALIRAEAEELVDDMFERGELRRLDNNRITEPKLFFAAYGVTTRKCSVVDE
jgi:hypothetical protein